MRQPHTTLVCLMGKLDGGPLAHESLVSRVLEPLGADLALLTEVADVKAADKPVVTFFEISIRSSFSQLTVFDNVQNAAGGRNHAGTIDHISRNYK